MAKLKLFKITLQSGSIGLIAASTLKKAEATALREEGSNNLRSVLLATKEDVAWVKAMCGAVPETE